MHSTRSALVPALLLSALIAACHVSSHAPNVPQDAGGAVYVLEASNGNGGSNFQAVALFPDPFASICSGAAAAQGACCYFAPPDAGATPYYGYSVGPIQIGDLGPTGAANALLAELDYDPTTWAYSAPVWGSPVWNANDLISAYAPGAQLPGFVLTAPAPAHIDGLSPAWDTIVFIPRSQDFPITWTPSDAGAMMRLSMEVHDSTNTQLHGYLFCETPDSTGTLTLPSVLLQQFAAGDMCVGCYMARGVDAADAGYLLRLETSVAGNATYGVSFQ